MNAEQESVILCEGYHDRAFWAELLKRCGCTDLATAQNNRRVLDPWKLQVAQGQYGFRSCSGVFVRIKPCNGEKNVLPEARRRLSERATKSLLRLAVCIDTDTDAEEPLAIAFERTQRALEGIVRDSDPIAIRSEEGDFLVDGGATRVSAILWHVSAPRSPGVPHKQTLERLVCAALASVYPARAAAVESWLTSRPDGPMAGPKEHAWSHMAGWYAKHHCEDFFREVWRDPSVADELEGRLRQSGAWRVIEELTR